MLSRISRRVARTCSLLVALGVCVLMIGGGTFDAAPQGQTKGFLIVESDLGFLYAPMEQECPQGFEMTVEEAFLASQTPDERARLLRPENAKELASLWKGPFIEGPGGENVCNNPKSFMNDPRHPPYRGVASTVAYGMNLDGTPDGRATAATCGHQKFTGRNGEPAIDNQLYRAVGCAKAHRGLGLPPRRNIFNELDSRDPPFLIEIRGLDDSNNDAHVDVGIYSTDDAPLAGSDGYALPNQTLNITKNARWRATAAGRIVNGQLTTDAVETVYLHGPLPTWGVQGLNYDFEFHRARLRLALQPDGTMTGMLAAYRPIDNIFTVGRCCRGTATTGNTNCASEHKTLALMADGHPDPDTGQCTTISSVSTLKGIPVFIVPPREELSSTK